MTIRDSTTRWFFLFILLHLVLWTLTSTLVRPTIPHDAVESIAWGWQWQLGYDKHPPLAAWLSAGITDLFHHVGWPAYLIAQLGVIVAFFAVWRLALRITQPLYALISVLLLEGIIYYNVASTRFTPDTVQTPLWALLIWNFYVCLKENRWWQWAILGLLAALACWGKYQAPLLFIPMFLCLLMLAEGRRSLTTCYPYLAGLIAILLFLPHLVWTYHHHFPELDYALNSTTGTLHSAEEGNFLQRHLGFPFQMLIDQLGALVGFIIMLIPFYFGRRTSQHASSFDIVFLSMMAFGPLALTLLYSLISGSYLIHRWSTPYFSVLGLWAMVLLRPTLSRRRLQSFVILFLGISLFILIGRSAWLGYIGPYWKKNTTADAYYPAKPIAMWATDYWQQQTHTPLKYIAANHYLAAYITVYSPDRPIPYMGFSKKQSPWIHRSQLKRQGAMIAWQTTPDAPDVLPANVQKQFPNAKVLPKQIFYKETGAEQIPIAIGFAILMPTKTN